MLVFEFGYQILSEVSQVQVLITRNHFLALQKVEPNIIAMYQKYLFLVVLALFDQNA